MSKDTPARPALDAMADVSTLTTRLRELMEERGTDAADINLGLFVRNNAPTIIRLLESVDGAEKALAKLSCLGNGELPGNSTGNVIAQAALATLRAAREGAR